MFTNLAIPNWGTKSIEISRDYDHFPDQSMAG